MKTANRRPPQELNPRGSEIIRESHRLEEVKTIVSTTYIYIGNLREIAALMSTPETTYRNDNRSDTEALLTSRNNYVISKPQLALTYVRQTPDDVVASNKYHEKLEILERISNISITDTEQTPPRETTKPLETVSHSQSKEIVDNNILTSSVITMTDVSYNQTDCQTPHEHLPETQIRQSDVNPEKPAYEIICHNIPNEQSQTGDFQPKIVITTQTGRRIAPIIEIVEPQPLSICQTDIVAPDITNERANQTVTSDIESCTEITVQPEAAHTSNVNEVASSCMYSDKAIPTSTYEVDKTSRCDDLGQHSQQTEKSKTLPADQQKRIRVHSEFSEKNFKSMFVNNMAHPNRQVIPEIPNSDQNYNTVPFDLPHMLPQQSNNNYGAIQPREPQIIQATTNALSLVPPENTNLNRTRPMGNTKNRGRRKNIKGIENRPPNPPGFHHNYGVNAPPNLSNIPTQKRMPIPSVNPYLVQQNAFPINRGYDPRVTSGPPDTCQINGCVICKESGQQPQPPTVPGTQFGPPSTFNMRQTQQTVYPEIQNQTNLLNVPQQNEAIDQWNSMNIQIQTNIINESIRENMTINSINAQIIERNRLRSNGTASNNQRFDAVNIQNNSYEPRQPPFDPRFQRINPPLLPNQPATNTRFPQYNADGTLITGHQFMDPNPPPNEHDRNSKRCYRNIEPPTSQPNPTFAQRSTKPSTFINPFHSRGTFSYFDPPIANNDIGNFLPMPRPENTPTMTAPNVTERPLQCIPCEAQPNPLVALTNQVKYMHHINRPHPILELIDRPGPSSNVASNKTQFEANIRRQMSNNMATVNRNEAANYNTQPQRITHTTNVRNEHGVNVSANSRQNEPVKNVHYHNEPYSIRQLVGSTTTNSLNDGQSGVNNQRQMVRKGNLELERPSTSKTATAKNEHYTNITCANGNTRPLNDRSHQRTTENELISTNNSPNLKRTGIVIARTKKSYSVRELLDLPKHNETITPNYIHPDFRSQTTNNISTTEQIQTTNHSNLQPQASKRKPYPSKLQMQSEQPWNFLEMTTQIAELRGENNINTNYARNSQQPLIVELPQNEITNRQARSMPLLEEPNTTEQLNITNNSNNIQTEINDQNQLVNIISTVKQKELSNPNKIEFQTQQRKVSLPEKNFQNIGVLDLTTSKTKAAEVENSRESTTAINLENVDPLPSTSKENIEPKENPQLNIKSNTTFSQKVPDKLKITEKKKKYLKIKNLLSYKAGNCSKQTKTKPGVLLDTAEEFKLKVCEEQSKRKHIKQIEVNAQLSFGLLREFPNQDSSEQSEPQTNSWNYENVRNTSDNIIDKDKQIYNSTKNTAESTEQNIRDTDCVTSNNNTHQINYEAQTNNDNVINISVPETTRESNTHKIIDKAKTDTNNITETDTFANIYNTHDNNLFTSEITRRSNEEVNSVERARMENVIRHIYKMNKKYQKVSKNVNEPLSNDIDAIVPICTTNMENQSTNKNSNNVCSDEDSTNKLNESYPKGIEETNDFTNALPNDIESSVELDIPINCEFASERINNSEYESHHKHTNNNTDIVSQELVCNTEETNERSQSSASFNSHTCEDHSNKHFSKNRGPKIAANRNTNRSLCSRSRNLNNSRAKFYRPRLNRQRNHHCYVNCLRRTMRRTYLSNIQQKCNCLNKAMKFFRNIRDHCSLCKKSESTEKTSDVELRQSDSD